MSGELSAELRTFILDHISSVAQLEALLLLWSSGRGWTADAVAQELRIDPSAAREQLNELAERGLADGIDPSGSFRYKARLPGVDAIVAELKKTYEDRRVSIIGLIYSAPGPRVKEFANAFRIRKDEDG